MNNKSAQTALFGSALLLIAVFALNILISTGLPGLRLDLTQDKLYSLSDGVSPLLRELDEPVRLDFYYSKKSAENLPNFRTYGQRVQEFLEEMVQASNGKLSLRVLDPEPFSEAEDLARAAQLSRIQIDGAGRELTLGLVAVNSVDEQCVIPYLDPTQERFLEYEVMRSVLSIGRLGRPTVGLVTSLDMANSRPTNNADETGLANLVSGRATLRCGAHCRVGHRIARWSGLALDRASQIHLR